MNNTLSANDRRALQVIAEDHPTSVMAFARLIWPRFTAKSMTTPGRYAPSIDNIRAAAASVLRGLIARGLVARPTGIGMALTLTREGQCRMLTA